MEIRYRKDWGTDLLVDDKTGGKMRNMVIKGIKRALILLAVFAITLVTIRMYDTQRGPPLARWHTYVPRELRATELDAADWSQYLAEEPTIFETLRTEVTQKLDPDDRIPLNRYFEGGPVYPAHFFQDFNRSYVLEPDRVPVAANVTSHGSAVPVALSQS
jgi:hypothetical protein